ncbi:hypothetical protein [Amycolatopsis pigmentata]|uniref:hypothetical protein n=1 Tax=Amycolatopsis pigmentata TaxID=450801 RepID=UPI00366AEBE5
MLAAFALGAFALGALAPPANAEYQEDTGRPVTPGQPFGGKSQPGDWLGSYLVGGKPVFCVAFELKAPDTGEKYQPGDELRTKWGDPLPAATAANISYLLLRYGDTKDPDQAAALAHLLHSWTAAPRAGHDDLNPANDFRHIGYDAPYHLAKLPAEAREDVRELTADAEANRGPWTAAVDAPREDKVGDAGDWTITVRNAKGKGVAKVPVTVELADAKLPDGSAKTTVTTGDDGRAKIRATPAGPDPRLVAGLSAPADKPYVRFPVSVDTQRVVSTGGEKHLRVEKAAKGKNKPGQHGPGENGPGENGPGGNGPGGNGPGHHPAHEANQVPTVIPAGAPPSVVLRAGTTTSGSATGFAVTGGLALAGSALVGFVARRRTKG